MRIRITKQTPAAYQIQGTAFRVGQAYNLDSALASALLAEGCAELDDTLTPSERRERDRNSRREMWEATDRKRAPMFKLIKPDENSDSA